jgi:transcriptional antiterminator NusG
MDDLNMANGQPAAEIPQDAVGSPNAPEALPPAAEVSALNTPPEPPPALAEAPAEEKASTEEKATAEEKATLEKTAVEEVATEAKSPARESPPVAKAAPVEAKEEKPAEAAKSDKMDWFILKVQSNREESIREGLMRRVAIAGLDYYFSEIIVPTEKVTEFKGGKKKVIKRKLYPGYLVVHMEINDDTWFLVRETPGIGDFTGAAGRPSPMLPHEVSRIVAKQEEKSEKAPKLKIAFREGERVKIKEGTFESFEGDVDSIDETNGRVTVMINIFGRSTPVELEYWQIEAL